MDEEHEIRMSQYKSRSSSRLKFYETDFERDGQWDQESSVQLYLCHRKKFDFKDPNVYHLIPLLNVQNQQKEDF